MNSIRRLFCAVLVTGFLQVTSLSAQVPGERWDWQRGVEHSEAIVRGRVVAIDYRMSEPGDGYLVAPHSFITYDIDEVLRGSVDGSTLTLRFLGGYEPSTGRVMLLPGDLYFREGDHDVVFVAGNGTSICPLTGCGLGRFRVVEGKIFSSIGLAVRLRDDESLAFGPDSLPDGIVSMVVPPAPDTRLDAIRQQLLEQELDERSRTRLESMLDVLSKPQTIGIARRDIPIEPPAQTPMSLEMFEDLIERVSERYSEGSKPISSASPDQPFYMRAPRPAPTPVIGRPMPDQPMTSDQQRLLRNHGDPVPGGQQ